MVLLFCVLLIFFVGSPPLEEIHAGTKPFRSVFSDNLVIRSKNGPKEGVRAVTQIQTQHGGSSSEKSLVSSSFGSQAVMAACWSPQELMGRPEEKRIVKRLSPPHHDKLQKNRPKTMRSPLEPELQNSIRFVKPTDGKKVIALTFDLCESLYEVSGYDADIVNYLREHHVKATFFISGLWMLSHPERTMQLMADPLFEVGNHSWSHRDFRLLNTIKIKEQILKTQVQYEFLREELGRKLESRSTGSSEMDKIPSIPFTFRFPYGTCNREALDILAQFGLSAIQWSVVSGDADRRQTAQTMTHVVLRHAKPGSIIICHANGRNPSTVEALALFIPDLLVRGYAFVTVSELLSLGEVVKSDECYELKPGDLRDYGHKSRKVK